jgi:argininosuccinate lyase
MLAERNLLDKDDAAAIRRALVDLEGEGDPPAIDEVVAFEGPYFYIEDALAAAVGRDAAGRLHTGRSRNDLYAAATRMAVRERLLGTVDATLRARSALLDRAAGETETVMPAFTHSRPAQPITLAHYLLAVDHALDRHVERLRAAYEDANRNPLGAAAIGGTGFPIDRERLAGLLGFDGLAYNTYDAIGGVDYLPAAAAAVAGTLTTISRTSQDMLVWSMVEVGFLEQTEALSTVSSIMPQKKNPGVIEKTRAAAAEAIGAATSSSTALQATPFGDVGETWDAALPTLRSSTAAADALALFAAIIEDIQVDEERMHADAVENFSTMTEVADTLVRELDLPFRAAHETVLPPAAR